MKLLLKLILVALATFSVLVGLRTLGQMIHPGATHYWVGKIASSSASDPLLSNELILWLDVALATNTTIVGAPTNGQVINDITLDLSPRNNPTTVGGTVYYMTNGGGDGVHPYLTLTNDCRVNTTASLTNSTSFTMGIVWQPLSPGDDGPFWADAKSSDGVGVYANVDFNGNNPDNLGTVNAYNLANGGDLETDTGSRSANWQVGFFVSNGANSSIWLNGNQIKTGTVGTARGLTNGPAGSSGWGGMFYGGVNWCSINFSRGLIWGRALTSNEVYSASQRCMTDFGITP